MSSFIVGQNVKISSSDIFRDFFLSAQIETKNVVSQTSLQVLLSRNYNLSIDVKTTDSSSHVLQQLLCHQLDLPSNLLPYFDLYVLQKDNRVVRKLERFESPVITIANLDKISQDNKHVLTVRKSYWDISFDHDLLSNDVGLQLLYYQALRDVNGGCITSSAPKEVKHQLAQFEAQDRKSDFLTLVRTLKFYSFLHIEDCICDFPEPGSKVTVSVGAKELLIRLVHDPLNSLAKEHSFKVTRIRCWRLTACSETMLSKMNGSSTHTEQPNTVQRLELSFEYLMNKDNLKWINIESDQSVLISMCLQSMVQELLTRRTGTHFGSNTSSMSSSSSTYSLSSSSGSRNSWSFLKRDSQTGLLCSGSNGSSQESISSSSMNGSSQTNSGIKYNARIRRVENDAFVGIGDDDL